MQVAARRACKLCDARRLVIIVVVQGEHREFVVEEGEHDVDVESRQLDDWQKVSRTGDIGGILIEWGDKRNVPRQIDSSDGGPDPATLVQLDKTVVLGGPDKIGN